MLKVGTHTDHEIQSQPESWRAALEVLSQERGTLAAFGQDLLSTPGASLIVTGCGSTYYLAQAAAAAIQAHVGVSARALPASEVWLNTPSRLRGSR